MRDLKTLDMPEAVKAVETGAESELQPG